MQQSSSEQASILIVEDDDVDAEAMHRLFTRNGITNTVVFAKNGIEALRILRGEDAAVILSRPFVVLLDINMPLMNGLELLEQIRTDQHLKHCIVFVVTSSPRTYDMRLAYEYNVAGYFIKNDLKELVTLLRAYCAMNAFPPQIC